MSFNWFNLPPRARRPRAARRASTPRLSLERLEDRLTPSTTTTLIVNPSTIIASQSFRAAVRVVDSLGTPAGIGQVDLLDNGQVIGTQRLEYQFGLAFFTVQSGAPGLQTITASYSQGLGDSSASQTVNVLATTNATASVSPSTNVPFGQSISFVGSASSPFGGQPEGGTMTFFVDGTPMGDAPVELTHAGFVADLPLSSLPVGPHTLTTQFNGDPNLEPGLPFGFAASPLSAPVSFTITPAVTTTALSSAAGSSFLGQPVVLTSQVTAPGVGVAPTGSVIFTIDSSSNTFAEPLVNGAAVLVVPSLALGQHTVTATYQGDINFGGSSGTFTQNVVLAPATVTLTVIPGTTPAGGPITLAGTVSGGFEAALGPETPTGTVTFAADGVPLGTVGLAGGGASLTVSSLAVGAHHLTAHYNGDSFFNAADAPAVDESVNPVPTTATLGSTPGTVVAGQPVAFAATVTALAAGGLAPTGSVDFFIDTPVTGTPSATQTLSGSSASFLTALTAGSHTVRAVYRGAAGVLPSTSPAEVITVGQAADTLTVASNAGRSQLGQTVIFRAVVRAQPAGAGTPTGNVAFFADGAFVGSAPLDAQGRAALPVSTLGPGPHQVMAAYQGDGNFLAATPAAVAQTVFTASVTSAFGPFGLVVEVVAADGTLTQLDAAGAHLLGGGVSAADVAFGPGGEELLVTFQDGQLVLFDAGGARLLGGGVLSAAIAFGPAGFVYEVVSLNGTLTQFDATGAHVLGSGVRSAGVTFGPTGAVLDLIFQDGSLWQFDSAGAHELGGGVLSAGVAFGPAGEVLDVVLQDGSLWQFDAAGAHALGKLF
jgi:hypothetical protein